MTLSENSVLMKFGAGTPTQSRKDKRTTSEVKRDKALGADSGSWVAALYPPGALSAIKQIITEARAYHDEVTLPFGVKGEDADPDAAPAIAGVGILPAALIVDYREQMRKFSERLDRAVSDFLLDPWKWVDWAIKEHNGTFEPRNYPGCQEADALVQAHSGRKYSLDVDQFRQHIRKRCWMRSEILPVPQAKHFTDAIASLLGTDTQSVDLRIQDAETEARREVMRRLIEPVRHMASKLAEAPKVKKDGTEKADIVFRDTLIGNIKSIVAIAPKLNITGDPEIDKLIKDVEPLSAYDPDALREDKMQRKTAAEEAAAVLKRLEGYKL